MAGRVGNHFIIDDDGNLVATDERPYIERSTINRGMVYFNDYSSPKDIAIVLPSDGDDNFIVINPVTTFTNWCNFEDGGSDNGTLKFVGEDCTMNLLFTASYGSTDEKDVIAFKGVTSGGTELFKIYDTTVKANGINTVTYSGIFDFVTDDEITVEVANITDAHALKVYTFSLAIYG